MSIEFVRAIAEGLGAALMVIAIVDDWVCNGRLLCQRAHAFAGPPFTRLGYGLRRLTGWSREDAIYATSVTAAAIWLSRDIVDRSWFLIVVGTVILFLCHRFSHYVAMVLPRLGGMYSVLMISSTLAANWLGAAGWVFGLIAAFMPEGDVDRISLKVRRLAPVRT